MGTEQPLDRLIRRLASGSEALEPGARRVTVDARNGKILEGRWMDKLRRDQRHYAVVTGRKVEVKGSTYRLRSRSTDRHIDFESSLSVWCSPGDEGKLASAVSRGESPTTALSDFVLHALEEAEVAPGRTEIDLCLEWPEIGPEIRSEIERRAHEELGLHLDLRLVPQLEPRLAPVAIQSGSFSVRPKDSDKQIEVKIVADLEVHPEEKIRALLYYSETSDLEDLVRSSLKEALAADVTLHELRFESTQVRRRLTDAIDRKLREVGRRVAFLGPLGDAPPPRDLPEIALAVACKVRDCEEEIEIRHRVLASLVDLGRFQAAGIADAAAWVRARLNRITRDALFDCRYLDLLLEFGRIEEEIRSAMVTEADAIGYRIRQLIVEPELEQRDWLDRFFLEANDGTYPTQDSRVEVRLDVLVEGKITDLRDPRFARYLTPKSRFFEDLSSAIRQETRQVLHGIDPERFYMRFQQSDIPDELPVKDEVERSVARKLEERFATEVTAILAKPLETDLTKLLALLRGKTHWLDVSCPAQDDLSEEVVYRIGFNVLGVHREGWFLFRSCGFGEASKEVEPILEVLREHLAGRLGTAPRRVRQYQGPDDEKVLGHWLMRSISEKVAEAFGLVVRVTTWRRLLTKMEEGSRQGLERDHGARLAFELVRRQQRQEELELLWEERKEIYEAGFSEHSESLVRLNQQIESIETELGSNLSVRGKAENAEAIAPARIKGNVQRWLKGAAGGSGRKAQLPAAPGESQ